MNALRLRIRALLMHARSVLLRRRLEREMQEEMAEHLERPTTRLVARGMSPAAARRAAEREFGNVPLLQDQARDARGTEWLDALLGDLRYALRQYARRPAITLVMVTVLAVGMTITTLLFSFVHGYATQPPPGIVLTDDLVRIRGSQAVHGQRVARSFSGEELSAYRALTDHFREVAGWTVSPATLDAGAEQEQRGLEGWITFVTDNYFRTLGVQPLLGPGLATSSPNDAGALATAVISHGVRQQLFSGAADIIGRTVTLNGVTVTVVGVMPERFTGVSGGGRYNFWMPLDARAVLTSRLPSEFHAAGRLQPGVTIEQASAATAVVAAAVATKAADAGAAVIAGNPSTDVLPLRAASDDPMFERDVKRISAGVGLLALLVLLVTCTNVSALLTGLASARRHEIGIRLSLGAARGRLIRQLVTESALLACIAAAIALALSWAVLRGVAGWITLLEPRLTLPATLFTFGTALTVGVLFGMSPALHATRLAVAGVLRDASATLVATRARPQRALVVAQIALTQPLMVMLAAVLILVLSEFQAAPRPDAADRIAVLSVSSTTLVSRMDPVAEKELRSQLRRTMHEAAEHVRALPGVVAVVPEWQGNNRPTAYAANAAGDVVALASQPIDAGYLDVMGIPLLRGRTFDGDDVAALHTATIPTIIDAALARELWPYIDPVGQLLRPATDTTAAKDLLVVGVVDDPRSRRSVAGVDHFVFVPGDSAQLATSLLVRTAAPAAPLLHTMRTTVQDAGPGIITRAATLASIADTHDRNFRVAASGVSVAGLAALLLAAIGMYAVIAFSVGQRTREIAVRMAIGGDRRRIVRRFVYDGVRLCALGLAIGLPVGLLALRTFMSVSGMPHVPLPTVTLIAAASVALVATAAAWLPARRAAAVDPAVTLRSES
jgi:predicted permease